MLKKLLASGLVLGLLVMASCSDDDDDGGGDSCGQICGCVCEGNSECLSECSSSCRQYSAECQSCAASQECSSLSGLQGPPPACSEECSGGW